MSAIIIGLGGALVWLFGFSGMHIGASGWVFGLWAYILSRAWFQHSWGNLITAAVVALLYGGLVFGFLPRQGISFEAISPGHLQGLLPPKYFSRRPATGLMPPGKGY